MVEFVNGSPSGTFLSVAMLLKVSLAMGLKALCVGLKEEKSMWGRSLFTTSGVYGFGFKNVSLKLEPK